MEPDNAQLHKLESGQEQIMGRLAELGRDVKAMADEIGGVDTIGRDPRRPSIRARMHKLENDRSAADAATAAVAAAKELRATAGDKRFSRREKWSGLLLAGVVALGPYITLLLHH